MQYLGYNYRMMDIQSALGSSQMDRLGEFINRRKEIVELYNRTFRNIEELGTPY